MSFVLSLCAIDKPHLSLYTHTASGSLRFGLAILHLFLCAFFKKRRSILLNAKNVKLEVQNEGRVLFSVVF